MARRLWIIAVVTTVGVILAGCGQDAPIPPDDDSGEAHQKATEATVEKTEPRASLPKPPTGTLVFEGQRETGKLGGYCWEGVCIEATFEVPPGGEALSVPSGSKLLFEYGGTPPPSKVQAKAYALVRGKPERAGEALRLLGSEPEHEYLPKCPVVSTWWSCSSRSRGAVCSTTSASL